MSALLGILFGLFLTAFVAILAGWGFVNTDSFQIKMRGGQTPLLKFAWELYKQLWETVKHLARNIV